MSRLKGMSFSVQFRDLLQTFGVLLGKLLGILTAV